MQKKTDNEIKKDLAKSVQKALIAHQFEPDKIQEIMEFLGLVLGGMIGSIYQEDEHEREVARVTEHIKMALNKVCHKCNSLPWQRLVYTT